MQRCPFGERPRVRVMLVDVPVSSRNTSFVASSAGWLSFHAIRSACTSLRSCSLACRVFFKDQTPFIQLVPEGGGFVRYPMLGQPFAHLAQCQIRSVFNPFPQHRLHWSKARFPMPANLEAMSNTFFKTRLDLVHPYSTDFKTLGNIGRTISLFYRLQHPISQILRIRLHCILLQKKDAVSYHELFGFKSKMLYRRATPPPSGAEGRGWPACCHPGRKVRCRYLRGIGARRASWWVVNAMGVFPTVSADRRLAAPPPSSHACRPTLPLQTEAVFRCTPVGGILNANRREVSGDVALEVPGVRCEVLLGVRRRKDHGGRHPGGPQLARCFDVGLDDHAVLHRLLAAPRRRSGLVDAPECPAGHAIVVRNHLSDLRPLIEHGPCPTDVPIQMANLQMPLGSKHSGHFVDALRLGEEFFQGGLRLFLNFRNVARDFEGDLLRHEDSQAGARFGHLEQGEPDVDVTRRDAIAGDVANHIEHRARVHAQHRQPQPHQARYFLRTQTHERDWSYCSRRLRANS